MEKLIWPTPLQHLDRFQQEQGIEIMCKRDDQIHPIVSGNKWRKLSASIDYIKKHNIQHVLSFGGAYSNHLHALAYVCKQKSITLSVCVRGDYSHQLTPTLKDICDWGAKILFLSKLEYKNRTDQQFCASLAAHTKAQYVIPEGGSNEHVFEGTKQLYLECLNQSPRFTHIVVPVASAGTMAGLIQSARLYSSTEQAHILGIAMLKGENYLENLVLTLLNTQTFNDGKSGKKQAWDILHDYHHGGYAKASEKLLDFVNIFNQFADNSHTTSNLYLEPVYSGKVFFALASMLEQKILPINSRVIVIHTGGLQGLRRM